MPHTPGPFFAWDDGRTIGIVAEPDGDPIAIAEVVDHGDQTSEEQLLADQRLFAASARMLAALINLVGNGFTDEELARRWSWSIEAIREARAAIAAAEGR